ncbi:MAG: hypothetical protein ABL952_06970 [Pyrinomonadaceae bacterium]
MVDNWAEELEINGFVSSNGNGLYSTVDAHVIARLWEVTSSRSPDTLAIKMGIWVVDPFLDWAEQEVSLAATGFLTESGGDISENAFGKWWGFENEKIVLDTLINKGIPWLLEFSQIDNLIEHFEKGLSQGVPNAPSSVSWTSKIAERLIFRSNPGWKSVRRPVIYNYYLSLLYHHKDNLDESRNFASVWLDYVMGRAAYGGEPERTYRHLEATDRAGEASNIWKIVKPKNK